MYITTIQFPAFSGIRCLMMPYIQGVVKSLPVEYIPYFSILEKLFIKENDIGYLTIDESQTVIGKPHRGGRAKYERALHTEAGQIKKDAYCWGGHVWGGLTNVSLEPDVSILLANNLNDSCAIWDKTHQNTSPDGDIGDCAKDYPYTEARLMKAGEVQKIGILTPHESLPIKEQKTRQFLRIVSSGVHGREPYFTENKLLANNLNSTRII